MNTVKILIHNADNTEDSQWKLFELSRSGVPEGTIISGVINWNNKSVSFASPDGDNCSAYIDHTCTVLQPLSETDIAEGNIIHRGGYISTPYVITKVGYADITLSTISTAKELRSRITVKRTEILSEYFWLGRMSFEEFDDY